MPTDDNQSDLQQNLIRATLSVCREEGPNWLFTTRTILALYIVLWLAMRFSLQPTTSMMAVIILANPQSGMVLAKSFYRLAGTLGGAAAAVALVGLFPQERMLFLPAIAIWIGLCVGRATYYRNFNSYAMLLCGYTAIIVIQTAISDPSAVFDAAMDRVAETVLAVVIYAVISDIIFPARMFDTLRHMIRRQFNVFVDLVRHTARESVDPEVANETYAYALRMAVQLENMRGSAIFEDARIRARNSHLLRSNQHLVAAMFYLRSLHELIDQLRTSNRKHVADVLLKLNQPLDEILVSVDGVDSTSAVIPHLTTMRENELDHAFALRAELSSDEYADFDAGFHLQMRFLDELLGYIEIAAVLPSSEFKAISIKKIRAASGNDVVDAILTGTQTTFVILALSVFWICSAWPSGPQMLMLATIYCSLMSRAPNAASAVMKSLVGFVFGIFAAWVCAFWMLPNMDGFALLIGSTLPFLLIGFSLMLRPTYALAGTNYLVGFISMLSISNPMTYDPVSFINNALAQTVGIGLAACVFAVAASSSRERWIVHRLLGKLWRQIGLAAQAPLFRLENRIYDNNRDTLNQIVAHTQADNAETQAIFTQAVRLHGTAREVIELRRHIEEGELPLALKHKLNEMVCLLPSFDVSNEVAMRNAIDAAVVEANIAVANGLDLRRVLGSLHLIRMTLSDASMRKVKSMFHAFNRSKFMM
ncbi:FUSC family protein [Burkholderia cenocepacia]|uniref:FUSC family protein n=1 Tax=Burkholderia cenocepacia TaxID=95486 RepID=UPI000D894B47|nr:FUSC family protein [Burkholderia cenocepacia]SPU91193.1 fusaric acid resistance protein [Burkholderia cenocepacia]